MAQKYKRPIWLTEFACGLAGSIQILTQVMESMLTMLDNQPMVARRAQSHHTLGCAGASVMASLCGGKMVVFIIIITIILVIITIIVIIPYHCLPWIYPLASLPACAPMLDHRRSLSIC